MAKMKKCKTKNCNSQVHAKSRCKKHYRLLPHLQYKNKLYRKRHSSKLRGIKFTLTSEQLKVLLTQTKCHYCPKQLNTKNITLDRLNSNKGYTYTNTVASCRTCNLIKSDELTDTEMFLVVKLISKLRNKIQPW